MIAVRFAPQGWLGVVVIVAGTMVGLPVGGFTRLYANTAMIRARIHAWLGQKFSTWDEAGAWMAKTEPSELDFLASIEDSAWTPDTVNGGAEAS